MGKINSHKMLHFFLSWLDYFMIDRLQISKFIPRLKKAEMRYFVGHFKEISSQSTRPKKKIYSLQFFLPFSQYFLNN